MIERGKCMKMDVQQEKGGFLRFCGAAASDRGLRRENNEDNYILDGRINPSCAQSSQAATDAGDAVRRWHIAGVFDGMGGGEAGELAALYCAQAFKKGFAHMDETSAKEQVDFWMRASFQEANNAIVELQRECRVLGSTATVMCTDGAVFKIYHLGDSRAYLARENALLQLTSDQTLAQMKLDTGLCRPDDPSLRADSHKLTEYVGRDRTMQRLLPAESLWIPVQPGDGILLCSDGLYGMCGDEVLADLFLAERDCSQRAEALLRRGVAMGGTDNITCVTASFD